MADTPRDYAHAITSKYAYRCRGGEPSKSPLQEICDHLDKCDDITAAITAAVEEEREACVVVVEKAYSEVYGPRIPRILIAKLLRSRGEKNESAVS